ncbi:MAG: hypothetical protein WCF67_10120, partial [Chitinophagaceae bacterium]
MADFEKAFQDVVLRQQGPNLHFSDHADTRSLLCSECFNDEGLRIDAFQIGREGNDQCPNCGSTKGLKLDKALVLQLCHRFFVLGSIHKTKFGGAPQIEFNEFHFNQSEIAFPEKLEKDVKLLEQAGKIGFFLYGPRLWMVGENEPLLSLQNEEQRDDAIEYLLKARPSIELTKDDYFYRLRKDPSVPHADTEYDT